MQPEYFDPEEEIDFKEIYFHDDSEEIAVKKIAKNQYLIQSFVTSNDAFNWGDLIEVEENDDRSLTFVEVVEKTDWILSEDMAVGSDFADSEFELQLRNELYNLGGYCETRDGYCLVALPPNAGVTLEELWEEVGQDEVLFMGEED